MNFYFAPMDGITDYLYRQIVWKYFPYWDKLYAPFIQPNDRPVIVPKEDFEICPENNINIPVVPQVLTNDAEGFVRVGRVLEGYGYGEINFNIGCPAKIIVSKGKGAGMLRDEDELDEFLYKIFSYDWKADITVKTRLGFTDNVNFSDLLNIFLKYPIKELIIHPRFRTDFYEGEPRLEEFSKAYDAIIKSSGCNINLCYNGNINSVEDYMLIKEKYPYINSVMIGRGGLSNPGLIRELKAGKKISLSEFKDFHDDILATYKGIGFSDKLLMYKMKEMWNYWSDMVDCSIEVLRALRLSKTENEYMNIMNNIYNNWRIKENYGFRSCIMV